MFTHACSFSFDYFYIKYSPCYCYSVIGLFIKRGMRLFFISSSFSFKKRQKNPHLHEVAHLTTEHNYQ